VLNKLKNSFFEFALGFFSENLGAVSEEQGERFHGDIKEMERRYQGRWNVNMMGDYCLTTVGRYIAKFRKPQKRNSNIRSFVGKRKRQYKAIE
jgi:hypothetical protein